VQADGSIAMMTVSASKSTPRVSYRSAALTYQSVGSSFDCRPGVSRSEHLSGSRHSLAGHAGPGIAFSADQLMLDHVGTLAGAGAGGVLCGQPPSAYDHVVFPGHLAVCSSSA
jgi:hypothetical protein